MMFESATVAILAVAAFAVAGLLWSEALAPRLAWFFKPLASLCFVALALQLGALDSRYGVILLVGLLLSLGGDVLLIAQSERAFLLGLTSFLLGHVAYLLAFAGLPTSMTGLLASIVPVLVLGVFSLRWLWPRLPAPMRLPVCAYIVVICAMLLGAGGTLGGPAGLWIAVGAWGFAVSDLAVARNQFVSPGLVNRLWGLPLYFAAQLVLAASVAQI